MAALSKLNTQLVRNIGILSEQHKREVLRFIEYLRTQENTGFLAYVNARTRQAVEDKRRGKHFTTLAELQQEYAAL